MHKKRSAGLPCPCDFNPQEIWDLELEHRSRKSLSGVSTNVATGRSFVPKRPGQCIFYRME
jgi:hypothetical protein